MKAERPKARSVRKLMGSPVSPRAPLARIGALAAVGLYLGPCNAPAPPAGAQGAPEVGGSPPMPRQLIRLRVPKVRVEVVARDLQIPWAIAFAPDGRLLFTERPGRVQVIAKDGNPALYLDLRQVTATGEGGLMGLALHPDFARKPFLYVMYTTRAGGRSVNRISRFTDAGATARNEAVLVDGIPASQYHDGGALAFGPDGMLYAGTGDARSPSLAQDLRSLAGKILRITPDGGIPADNPIPGSPVYAYGFRNVTALAWRPETGDLWAASHGPSGEFRGLYHRDSVYVVQKGGNHGWPLVVGTTTRPGIVSPILYYPASAMPPGGALFYTGSLLPRFQNSFFLTGLRSEHLQRVVVGPDKRVTAIERLWPNRYGRLRAIAQGPDGSIYFSTSNRDGRARRYFPGSDYIYRIVASR